MFSEKYLSLSLSFLFGLCFGIGGFYGYIRLNQNTYANSNSIDLNQNIPPTFTISCIDSNIVVVDGSINIIIQSGNNILLKDSIKGLSISFNQITSYFQRVVNENPNSITLEFQVLNIGKVKYVLNVSQKPDASNAFEISNTKSGFNRTYLYMPSNIDPNS